MPHDGMSPVRFSLLFQRATAAASWLQNFLMLRSLLIVSPLFITSSTTVLRGRQDWNYWPQRRRKSTLLLILGELEPDTGRLRQGTKIQLAYFDQDANGTRP